MNNHRERHIEDTNQSSQLLSTLRRPLQTHDFMPMPLNGNHQTEEARKTCFKNQLKQNIESFWRERLEEICEAPSDVRVQNALPLARVKKVMKSDQEVKMISADTPVLFAKACEMFIMELSMRAWMHTQQHKRRTLQRNDVANAIRDEDLLLFLNDMVPMEMLNQDVMEAPPSDDLENNNHHGVYVPLPPQENPNHPFYQGNFTNGNIEVAATEHRPVEIDHLRLPFPMNLQYTLTTDYFTRMNQEMQQQGNNHVFPPQSPPDANGSNHPYFPFKDYLQ